MAGERSFASLGAKVSELEVAWKDRLEDANHLRSAGRYLSAIAMGLYALEILLKVRICRRLDLKSLPKPFEIHELDGLLIVSGLSRKLVLKPARQVRANWTKLKQTAKELNDLRYQPNTSKTQFEAEEFL